MSDNTDLDSDYYYNKTPEMEHQTSSNTKANKIAKLEFAIGYIPFNGKLPSINKLNKGNVQSWCILQGVSPTGVSRARDESIKRAYNNHAYLSTWISNDQNRATSNNYNGGDINLNDLDKNFTPPAPEPKAAPSETLDIQSIAADIEAIASKTALKTMNQNIAAMVQTQLEANKFELSLKVKEQIKELANNAATSVAIDLIEKNKAPRQIEIFNPETKANNNIGVQHYMFPVLLKAAQARLANGYRPNIWITGPAGSGKTTAAEFVAKALNLNFYSDGSLDADYKIIGFKDAAGNVHRTGFLDIFEFGGVYCADEIDNWHSGALLALNSGLANGFIATPAGMIKRHPDCIVIACANTWGLGANSDYVGRVKLDAASLDRFLPKIDWPVDEKLERSLATSPEWCDLVQQTRRNAKRQGLKILITPRATISGCSLLDAGFTLIETIKLVLAAGISRDQALAIGLPNIPDWSEDGEIL